MRLSSAESCAQLEDAVDSCFAGESAENLVKQPAEVGGRVGGAKECLCIAVDRRHGVGTGGDVAKGQGERRFD